MKLTKENRQYLCDALRDILHQKELMQEFHGRLVWGDPQDDIHEAADLYEETSMDYIRTLERLVHKLASALLLSDDESEVAK